VQNNERTMIAVRGGGGFKFLSVLSGKIPISSVREEMRESDLVANRRSG
jgi:hypothetical protein